MVPALDGVMAGTLRAFSAIMNGPATRRMVLHSSQDPDGVGAVLQAVDEAARMRWLASIFLPALALFSLPVWVAAAWPMLMSAGLRHLLLRLWLFWAVGSLYARVAAAYWQRKLERSGRAGAIAG